MQAARFAIVHGSCPTDTLERSLQLPDRCPAVTPRTVSKSTSPSVLALHDLMQPKQKACSQASRPNLRAPGGCFSRTRSRQMPHSTPPLRARAATRSCLAVHSSTCSARSAALVGCSACLPHTCERSGMRYIFEKNDGGNNQSSGDDVQGAQCSRLRCPLEDKFLARSSVSTAYCTLTQGTSIQCPTTADQYHQHARYRTESPNHDLRDVLKTCHLK